QMLFVAFGALVLMPLITGLDPNVALFTAGLGTLLFQLVTGRQVPVFLASSLPSSPRSSSPRASSAWPRPWAGWSPPASSTPSWAWR
ncbi:solute carrier family 23 protein, partial [Enterobacter kobei]|uniref:solute carrier family 23 protein n=1 Tax=Enterobacter kobei TaxID=208224 RepID=UPI002E2B46BC